VLDADIGQHRRGATDVREIEDAVAHEAER
jgi:hypothetical protein